MGHETPICESEPVTTPLLLSASFGLFALILLSLFLHSLFIEWSKRKDPNFQILSTESRIGYIAMQFVALYWTTLDVIRYTIDPLTSFLPNTVGCVVLTYSSPILAGLFYAIYLYLVLLRLQNLDGSYLKTPRSTLIVLRCFILSVTAFQVAYLCVDSNSVCLQRRHPADTDRELWNCDFIMSANRIYVAIGGISMIAFLNLVMGALFIRKLQQVGHLIKENQHVSIQLRKIVIQNTILIATGSITTLVLYGLWAVFPSFAICSYLDLVINCVVIGLSFPHNRRWYKLLCGPCIECCWKKFDSKGSELPKLPTVLVDDMAIIGEDVVLELGLGLVPQNKDAQRSIDIMSAKESSESTAKQKKKRMLRAALVMRRPSGSLSVDDPAQSTSGSNTASKSSKSLSWTSGKTRSSVSGSSKHYKSSRSGSQRESKSSVLGPTREVSPRPSVHSSSTRGEVQGDILAITESTSASNLTSS